MSIYTIEPKPTKIQAILWDWGGVFNPQHEALAGYHSIAERYGHTAESLYALLYSGPEWQQARTGGLTSQAYWAMMQQRLAVPGDLETFLADLFAGEQIDQTLVAVARMLKQRYRVGLLSNALDDLETILEQRWQVTDCFDVIINSARLGAAKPDPRAFEAAIQALEVPKQTIVFIDDKLRNVHAARAIGLPTIHFTTSAALLDSLLQAGILTQAEYTHVQCL